jgi:hypothetical protein
MRWAECGPASAQLGAATQSPPPEGVAEGQGAGNPKGHTTSSTRCPTGADLVRRGGASGGGASAGDPKLKGEYLERYQAWRGEVAPTTAYAGRARSNCSPPGMPRIMRLAQYPYEFLFTPGG